MAAMIPPPPDPGPPHAMLADTLRSLDAVVVWTSAAMVVVGILLLIVTRIFRDETPVIRSPDLLPLSTPEHLAGYTPQERAELAEIRRVTGFDRRRRRV